jgi:hypothetical protein
MIDDSDDNSYIRRRCRIPHVHHTTHFLPPHYTQDHTHHSTACGQLMIVGYPFPNGPKF